ncbi:YciI family protein [Georgenia alba]|uniref:YciI family protein n=1 Tax=Georgenia alba TaxID=2233858 RepID=A0ABW2Q8F7_9MICO
MVQLIEADHYAKWAAATPEQRDRLFASLEAFAAAVRERGEVVAGEGLADPSTARTLRPGPDRPVTDGPYAETVEQLGGFYVIDVPDMDTAVELAHLLADHITVEIRPTTDG